MWTGRHEHLSTIWCFIPTVDQYYDKALSYLTGISSYCKVSQTFSASDICFKPFSASKQIYHQALRSQNCKMHSMASEQNIVFKKSNIPMMQKRKHPDRGRVKGRAIIPKCETSCSKTEPSGLRWLARIETWWSCPSTCTHSYGLLHPDHFLNVA